MLLQFYRSTVERVIWVAITNWHAEASEEDKNRLDKVVMNAVKTIGCDISSLSEQRILQVTHPILPICSSALSTLVAFVQLGVGL